MKDRSSAQNKSSKNNQNNPNARSTKGSKNFLAVPSPLKSNKDNRKNYETMSVGGAKSTASNKNMKKGPKSSVFDDDEWMGSLSWSQVKHIIFGTDFCNLVYLKNIFFYNQTIIDINQSLFFVDSDHWVDLLQQDHIANHQKIHVQAEWVKSKQ